LIYVTHDQTEALTFADHVVVMNDGEVLQQGSPQELFERPAHVFVAHFVGSPGMNLLPCEFHGGTATISGQPISFASNAATGALTLGIRPEFVGLSDPGDSVQLSVTVDEIEPLGGHQLIHARVGESRLAIKAAPEIAVPSGANLPVWLPRRWIRLYADGVLVA